MRNRNIIIYICQRKKYIFKQLGDHNECKVLLFIKIFFSELCYLSYSGVKISTNWSKIQNMMWRINSTALFSCLHLVSTSTTTLLPLLCTFAVVILGSIGPQFHDYVVFHLAAHKNPIERTRQEIVLTSRYNFYYGYGSSFFIFIIDV